MSKWPEIGVHHGVSFEEYRRLDAVNNSFLWTLKSRSPLHALYEREHPKGPTPDQYFGQVLHARLLEPAQWDKRYAVKPECDRRTKEGKALYETFCADRGDREEVETRDYEKVLAVERSVRAAFCCGLVEGGEHEVCLVWDDPETGIRMKARCDCVHEDDWEGDVIVDVKTAASAREDDFLRSIYKYGYFMQAAIYRAGWEALKGRTAEFTILAVEKEPPFVPADFPLGPMTMEAGRLAFRSALRTCIECRKSGYWPGYRNKNEKPRFIEMNGYQLAAEGVNQFQEHVAPVYTSGGVPEGQEECEFDEFMKGQ